MPYSFDRDKGIISDEIYIHFDVEGHYLSLDTFIVTSESARGIVKSLDETFFNGALDYELVVVPPEAGTFLTKLAIFLGGAALLFDVLDSDTLNGFVKGVTGKSVPQWSEQIGEQFSIGLEKANAEIQTFNSKDELGTESKSSSSRRLESAWAQYMKCKLGARVIVELTKGILEGETEKLHAVGMDLGDLPDAMNARSEFYKSCYFDKSVNRVGFTPFDDFPVPRQSFPERAQKPTRKDTDNDDSEWSVAIEEVSVTSPNWDKEDQNFRQWKGVNNSGKSCYFVVDDEEFWGLVNERALIVDVLDKLKVQWACKFVDGRARRRRVLRVLEFNGRKLADPLPPDAIRAIIGRYLESPSALSGPSLFDGQDARWKPDED